MNSYHFVSDNKELFSLVSIRERFLGLLQKLQIDSAVFFLLLTRFWQFIAGPISMLMIAYFFSKELQGFFYAFSSVLALQSFIELGFSVVIVNVASHEWAKLSLNKEGKIIGDQNSLSRLISLGQLTFKWYSIASVIFVTLVGLIGYVFFSQRPYPEINWHFPWFISVFIAGLLLITLPFISLLEGCNQVNTINKFRFYQAILGNSILWIALFLRIGLWAAIVFNLVYLLCNLYLLLRKCHRFFEPFLMTVTKSRIQWKTEIWPMQWKVGLSGIVGYFAFSLFVPVMFHYHGAVVAGQMGMTIQIITGLQGLALAWVFPKVPKYGMLIAAKDYRELDKLWFHNSSISIIVLILVSVIVWILVYFLNVLEIPFSYRILSPFALFFFLLAAIFTQFSHCLEAYLRAHKQEPIFVMAVTTCALTGILVWFLGWHFGPAGAGIGSFLISVLAFIWGLFIWLHCRSSWHK